MSKHREMYKRYLDGKCHKQMMSTDLFQEFREKKCKIELIELFPCSSKEELLKREGHYIRTTCCLNTHISGRTKEEYRLDTKDKKAEYDKNYKEHNFDKIKQRNKDRYDRSIGYVCPCGATYNYTRQSRHIKTKAHLAWEALSKEPEPEIY